MRRRARGEGHHRGDEGRDRSPVCRPAAAAGVRSPGAEPETDAEQDELHDDRIVGVNIDIYKALPDPEQNEGGGIIFFVPPEIADKDRRDDDLKKRTAGDRNELAERTEQENSSESNS